MRTNAREIRCALPQVSILASILLLCMPHRACAQDQALPADDPSSAPADANLTADPNSPNALAGSVDVDGSNGTIAPGGSVAGDILNFQADLFTGRFTYKVPIVVAPGRQGAQPQLAIGYNSGGGNGWCGVGWALDVGYIQRDTRKGVPVQWNPAASPTPLTQYDDSKGFIANFGGMSSPLVLVSPTNQNPVVYRQQVETAFLTYNCYSDSHWEVVDKSGNIFYFGEGLTNRMDNTNAG